MNSENNNNPNNVNTTEDSLFSDMPALISDTESESDTESNFSDMPQLVSDTEYDNVNIPDYNNEDEYDDANSSDEEDNKSETDYSDMPELISLEQLELINSLCKPFTDNQNLQNSLYEIPIYTIDSEDYSEDDIEDDFTNPL